MENKKINKKVKLKYSMAAILFLLSGIIVLLYDFYIDHSIEKKENKLIEEYFEQESVEVVNAVETNIESQVENLEIIENYTGILEIPKINLKRGFYEINNPNNNVNKNIEVLSNSDMPDVNNGIMAIAGHSGSGRVAFFKELNKLNLGDEIYIYYKNNKYIYEVSDIYEVKKTGQAVLKKTLNKSLLALITCVGQEEKQVVFISYLKQID